MEYKSPIEPSWISNLKSLVAKLPSTYSWETPASSKFSNNQTMLASCSSVMEYKSPIEASWFIAHSNKTSKLASLKAKLPST